MSDECINYESDMEDNMNKTNENNITYSNPTDGVYVYIVNKSNNLLPKYETITSAGMDIRAYITKDNSNKTGMNSLGELEPEYMIKPKEYGMIHTGIYLSIPKNYMINVHARSGLSYKKGIMVTNGVGVIDSDYRGECNVLLYNGGTEDFIIKNGDRIAQLVLQEVPRIEWVKVNTLENTERGSGGFGHTGIK